MRRRLARALPLLLAGALLFSACGGDDDDDTTSEAGDSPASAQEDTTTTAAAPATDKTKPEFEVPAGDPPAQLVVTDLEPGTGAEAKAGDTISVHYVGKAYSTREQFDASWDRGSPFPFTLGAGDVITGWDEGLVGMKVGGRRQLVIPPDKAYGANSPTPKIGPNDTLVFVVDLLSIG